MIQRTLLRQCKAAARSAAQPSLSRPRAQILPRFSQASRQVVATRWYATEPEAKKADGEAGAAGEAAKAEDPVKAELEKKDREIIDLKDKYLRSVADFRNLQERMEREMKSAKAFAIQKFAKDLVESVDNFERALDMVPAEKLAEKSESTKDLINLHDGLKMTETILMNTLKKHGLERFDPVGEKFNPNMHEALFMSPMADKEDNHVFHVQSKGFKLNERILRPAKVGVVKNA